jgi:hypothetical protein
MTHLEFHCSSEKATALLKAARLYDEGVELEPARRGKWLMITDSKHCGVCSECQRQDYIDPLATHCRYCGAKMDGGSNEK